MSAKLDMSIPLEAGCFYHIFNRSISDQKMFKEQENFKFFLGKYDKYSAKYWDTFAFALMDNHFHFLIKIKKTQEILTNATEEFKKLDPKIKQHLLSKSANLRASDLRNFKNLVNLVQHENLELQNELVSWVISERWRRFLLSYAKSFNKLYGRTGSLFQKVFRRKLIVSDADIRDVMIYLHHNPIHHGICQHFHEYIWTSYNSFQSSLSTKIKRQDGINLFEDLNCFNIKHEEYKAQWRLDNTIIHHSEI